jgi:hypothetical protein
MKQHAQAWKLIYHSRGGGNFKSHYIDVDFQHLYMRSHKLSPMSDFSVVRDIRQFRVYSRMFYKLPSNFLPSSMETSSLRGTWMLLTNGMMLIWKVLLVKVPHEKIFNGIRGHATKRMMYFEHLFGLSDGEKWTYKEWNFLRGETC